MKEATRTESRASKMAEVLEYATPPRQAEFVAKTPSVTTTPPDSNTQATPPSTAVLFSKDVVVAVNRFPSGCATATTPPWKYFLSRAINHETCTCCKDIIKKRRTGQVDSHDQRSR